jgi:hypothetical protein
MRPTRVAQEVEIKGGKKTGGDLMIAGRVMVGAGGMSTMMDGIVKHGMMMDGRDVEVATCRM